MEQTFNDLCNERKQQTEQGMFGFLVWIFVETALGVIKEHVQLITRGKTMKSITTLIGATKPVLKLIIVLVAAAACSKAGRGFAQKSKIPPTAVGGI